MLEYNADTPTALLEAAVAQWDWLKDVDQRGDQFNIIHERLIEAWKAVRERDDGPIHFAAMQRERRGLHHRRVPARHRHPGRVQDRRTSTSKTSAGTPAASVFVDHTGLPIHRCFKLYPWEWMVREEFGQHVPSSPTQWIEPAWKMILCCKSILPLLVRRCTRTRRSCCRRRSTRSRRADYVRKPVHAREGANIQVVLDGQVVLDTEGPYAGGRTSTSSSRR